MREIKFRMWHKNIKQMYDVGLINLQQGLIFMKNYLGYTQSSFAIEEVELMQYTGLKDKNGKYIQTTVEKAVIEYKGASFYGSTFADDWELDEYYEIEVIGNIYDNPELLEE